MLQFDVAHHVGAVYRELSSREVDGKPARVLVARRSYESGIDDVWDALTNPERIPRWFSPVSGDLKKGGRYQIEGNAGGTITSCDPPRSFNLTWEFGGETSWVQVTLKPDGEDRTKFELEHIAHVPDEFWDTYGPGAVGVGWDLAIMGLAEHLATGLSMDPAEAMAWPTTDNGKEFVRACSDAWGQASISNGTPEPQALAAAENTRQFYTGEVPEQPES